MNATSFNLSARLQHELSRLYLVGDSSGEALIGEGGLVRTLVMEVRSPADWRVLSTVWFGVQTELDWPAPGIAVSGTDGVQIWFSLAEPVDTSQAINLLAGLRLKFLGSVSPLRLRMFPYEEDVLNSICRHAMRVPALHETSGNWSAFVSQDLAAIFADEPWLDLPPNPDQQADILSKLQSVKQDQLNKAYALLTTDGGVRGASKNDGSGNVNSSFVNMAATPSSPSDDHTQSPKDFLSGVMNDPNNSLKDRIEAAKALLPYSD